jgi:hypothetical protein
MKKSLKKLYKLIYPPIHRRTIQPVLDAIELNRMLTAKLLIRRIRDDGPNGSLRASEFKVFSQAGEDGIIQFLISRVPIAKDVFVEFGVEDYSQSNTRFLMMNNNWGGVVIDADQANINYIKKTSLYWSGELTAVRAFINRDNINKLIESGGVSGDIGLLSVDIDGNDYWVWERIEVVSPRIVVCEYNNLFGSKEPVTIPYSEDFVRTKAHYSRLYFGASLNALCTLAERKGYKFVGCDSFGTNAFFVRNDVAGNLTALTCEVGYVKNKVRESQDRDGRLTFVSGDDRVKLIADMPVVDVLTGKQKLIRDLDLS